MTSLGTVGEICRQRGQLQIDWKLKDVFSLSKIVDSFYESPTFYLSGHPFYLQILCNGESEYNSEGWIGLYLNLGKSCPVMKVYCVIAFKTTEGKLEHEITFVNSFSEKGHGRGRAKALERSQLRRLELTPSDVLTISATLEIIPKSIVALKENPVGRIRESKSTPLCKELFWEIDDVLDLLDDMKGFVFPSSPFTFDAFKGDLLWDIRELFGDQSMLIYATLEPLNWSQLRCLGMLIKNPSYLYWSMGILCADGTKHNIQSGRAKRSVFSNKTLCWTGPSQSELLREKEKLLPGGVLTFFVQISRVDTTDASIQADENIGKDGCQPTGTTDVCIQTDAEEPGNRKGGCQPPGSEKVLEAIEKLWDSGENSDVIINVGDVEFKAHRAILGVRTPVLSAMFQHDTIEKTTGIVTISDCEPSIFEELLHYIYTGAPKELTTKNAPAIYALANKYLVEELKAQCLRFISSNMCVETFTDAVLLSLNYSEAELLELLNEFASKNIRKIMKSVEWQRFNREHSDEANEIMIKALGPE